MHRRSLQARLDRPFRLGLWLASRGGRTGVKRLGARWHSATMDTQADLADALATIRKRRRLVWVVLLAFVPAALLAQQVSESVFAAVVIGWFATWVAAVTLHGFSRCPRCRKFIYCAWLEANPLTRNCLHCGLSLTMGADSSDHRPAGAELP